MVKPYGYVRADGKGLFIYGDHQFTNNQNHDLVPVYTHPKDWVGLTEGEQVLLARDYSDTPLTLIYAVGNMLKEKNRA